MVRVLVVDDEPMHLRLAAEAVRGAGFKAVMAASGAAALEMLRTDAGIGVVLLDLVMPDLDGMAVMEAMNREAIGVPVIMQTGNSSLEIVISAMRQGATDFFVKPVSPERLAISLRNALKLKTLEGLVRAEGNRRSGTTSLADLVMASPAMARVAGLVQKAAKSPLPVLIEGENGTGKELVARAIAGMGERARKPFVVVNCGTVALNAIEAVLFGRKDGVGAESAGKFKQANNGTLYLDEIGELPLDVQEKLLRAMETGKIVPVGAGKAERADVRIIAASNRRLMHVAKAGGFREDLYYRLHVMPIYMPPLRERRQEIARLAGHFMAQVAAETGKRVTGLTVEALALLEGYDWPGNIAQLEAAVCRAVALAQSGMLEAADFPQILAQAAGRDKALAAIMALPVEAGPTHIDIAPARHRDTAVVPERFLDGNGGVTALADIERALIAFAIEHHEGRMSRVARALKIGRSTLYRKLREYGLEDRIERELA